MPRISSAQCLASYPNAIAAHMGCALDPGSPDTFTQACAGDSGGPVVVTRRAGRCKSASRAGGRRRWTASAASDAPARRVHAHGRVHEFLTQAKLPIAPFTNLKHAGATAVIHGSPHVGKTLTCDVSVKLGGDPAQLSYEWTKVNEKGIVPIPHATHKTLAVTAKLRNSVPFNHHVFCNAIARNAGG